MGRHYCMTILTWSTIHTESSRDVQKLTPSRIQHRLTQFLNITNYPLSLAFSSSHIHMNFASYQFKTMSRKQYSDLLFKQNHMTVCSI